MSGRRAAISAMLAASLALPSCVTETVKRRPLGTPAQRVSGGTLANPSGSSPIAARPAAPVNLPQGAIAAPATTEKTIDSRVTVAVRPIGIVPFDSMTLPLVSPDGHFLATQVGEPPTWATVLALPGAEVPRTTVRVFDLSVSPPRVVASGEPGLLLGRDADARGVLVESVRADASRWIGRMLWETGGVEWLARDSRVNAKAVFGPSGELVFTRRAPDATSAALVIRPPGLAASDDNADQTPAAEAVLKPPLENSSFSFPCVSPAGSTLMVFLTSPTGTEARVYPMGVTGTAITDAPPIARRQLAAASDPVLAYQSTASFQPFHAVNAGESDGERFLLHHPVMSRMAVFDPTTGLLTPLAERSIAGVYDAPSDGYFLTTPKGLVHQRLSESQTGPTALPEARVLSESWVARPTSSPASPFVLIGPGPKNQPGTLQITAMEVVR